MDRQTAELNAQAQMTSGPLIAADKVEGASVYNPAGEKLGTVDHVMIDKVSGQAVYAIMSFGGFLGIGERFHPLPWRLLKYDDGKGGYVVNLTRAQLEAAPTHAPGGEWTADYARNVDEHYGDAAPPGGPRPGTDPVKDKGKPPPDPSYIPSSG